MTTYESEVASVLDAVKDIVPRLRENGPEGEDRRWIPDENIDLLEKAGVFRIAVPRRFGGLDFSLEDQVKVLTEIARGDGSTGWVAVAWVSSAWMASLYPDRTQEEVFSGGSVKISGGFTANGTLVPTEGGYLLNGTWRFNTGCRGADWDLLATHLERPGAEPEEVFALVPMSELTYADDWHVSAAAGTGSSTTTAKDVFVPAHRVASSEEAVLGTTGDRSNTGATGRNYGLISYVMAESVAAYIGMAKAALELFIERLPGRGIAYTNWTDQSQHPLTQIQVSIAANKIAAAEALSAGYLKLLQERADAGEQPTWDEKATVRGQCGFAIQLVKEAVEALHTVSGASALSRSAHFQRFYRDLLGLSLHGMMAPNANFEVHGRVLLGLDPDTYLL
ncbi:acyl-CoA dehydrogenase family protein [Kitasatospora sp. SUK 42]|uniref:acyl-CoA dehydrogenase family protein n=1 Tax=Kitasatospora sp. SUK 42 TaxID=1588882 RepID=UPI0018CB4874|nr:acyl-CoA dehydrogenase family protein [Kitasatospora sp. SUK 42]MBV2155285.1 acyl-CoA dehydrogenase family protein [Kitasatospora sp. SUK 42]